MKFVALGHVHETGKRVTETIDAPNVNKARIIAQHWTLENGLVLDDVETVDEHAARTANEASLRQHGPSRTHRSITTQVAKGIKSMLEDAIAEGAFDIDLDNVFIERDRLLGEGYRINVTHGTTPIVSILVEPV